MRYIYLRHPFHMKTDELKCFEQALNDALNRPALFPAFQGFVRAVQLRTDKTSIIQAFQIATDDDEIARAAMTAILVIHRTIQLSWVELYRVEAPHLEIECFNHPDDVPWWAKGPLLAAQKEEDGA